MQCPRSRQLLFSQDPARFRKSSESVLSILMQEFDSQQTAETIITRLDDILLRNGLDGHQAKMSVRLFRLVGLSSQRLRGPEPLVQQIHQWNLSGGVLFWPERVFFCAVRRVVAEIGTLLRTNSTRPGLDGAISRTCLGRCTNYQEGRNLP